jgi:hypothetical protein
MHTDDTLKVDAAADLDFTGPHKYGFWVLPDGRLLRLVSGHASHDETADLYADQEGIDGGYAYNDLIRLGCVRFSRDARNDEAWINLHPGPVTVEALETTRTALSKLKDVLTYVILWDEAVEFGEVEGETHSEYMDRGETTGYAEVQRLLGKLIREHRKPGKEAA